MPSLKDLKVRIGSVKSTQKITKAMQMVAAAKLRRATERAEQSRPYAEGMEGMLKSLAASIEQDNAPKLLVGTGKNEKHLLVVMTSDRGLCGGFNSSIVRSVKKRIADIRRQNKDVRLFCVGKKGLEQLQGEFSDIIVSSRNVTSGRQVSYNDARSIAEEMLDIFNEGDYDNCTIVYNKFKSAMTQIVTYQQLIPLSIDSSDGEGSEAGADDNIPYEYEPEESIIMEDLLPRNINVQIFSALLENSASEQGARMTAMDNATRNAGEMIKKLTLQYNRSRQAAITKELIEIISGAEAV